MQPATSLADVGVVLHNSGPGPVAVYRTGAVGIERRIACAPVRRALGLHGAARAEQHARIADLKTALASRGLLLPFRGIVRLGHTIAGDVTPDAPESLPWLPGATAHEVLGWTLLAFAHVAPPMLLFTRAPSLTNCTDGHLLTHRWFGQERQV